MGSTVWSVSCLLFYSRCPRALWLASRCTSWNDYSLCWTPPLGWCFLRRGATTSVRYFASYTSWRLQNRSSISSQFWFTSALTEWRRRIWQMSFSSRQTLPPGHLLRSASSLFIRRTRLSTVGDRAFPVAAARVWNSLPRHVTSAASLSVYCSRLKSHLFKQSFPWLLLL